MLWCLAYIMFYELLLISFFLVHHESVTCTTSDHHDGVLINLNQSVSTLNFVSRHIFLHLRNRWKSCPNGLVTTPIIHNSFASSNSSFLFGYSNLLDHFILFACFCCWDFFAAIHLLFVLAMISDNVKVILLL